MQYTCPSSRSWVTKLNKTTSKMLALKNINLTLNGTQVIHDIGFRVSEGEIVCLLGPSGCGKTSVLRLIAGLEKPDSGSILIDGTTMSGPGYATDPHKRNIGFLFQDFALFPHLTVDENILYGLGTRNLRALRPRVTELLAQIKMSGAGSKYPHMLSGGEKQRVALARALAHNPKILLLDEPFSGLDAGLRNQLREETRSMLNKHGATAIIVTHDPEEAMMVSDRIILMNKGEIVQTGSPSDIYHRPKSKFAARFLGETNILPGEVIDGKVKTGLGEFHAEALEDGNTVDVLIRPDAIKITPTNEHSNSLNVCSVKDAGSSSMLKLGLGDSKEPHYHVDVRYRGPSCFRIGDRLNVEIDPDQVFIFKD